MRGLNQEILNHFKKDICPENKDKEKRLLCVAFCAQNKNFDPKVLHHPLVKALIDDRWNTYGRFDYIMNFALDCLLLASVIIYVSVLPSPQTHEVSKCICFEHNFFL